MTERRRNAMRREAFESLRDELKARLARVCAHFDSSELEGLTARMTRILIRYEPCTGVPERDRASME